VNGRFQGCLSLARCSAVLAAIEQWMQKNNNSSYAALPGLVAVQKHLRKLHPAGDDAAEQEQVVGDAPLPRSADMEALQAKLTRALDAVAELRSAYPDVGQDEVDVASSDEDEGDSDGEGEGVVAPASPNARKVAAGDGEEAPPPPPPGQPTLPDLPAAASPQESDGTSSPKEAPKRLPMTTAKAPTSRSTIGGARSASAAAAGKRASLPSQASAAAAGGLSAKGALPPPAATGGPLPPVVVGPGSRAARDLRAAAAAGKQLGTSQSAPALEAALPRGSGIRAVQQARKSQALG